MFKHLSSTCCKRSIELNGNHLRDVHITLLFCVVFLTTCLVAPPAFSRAADDRQTLVLGVRADAPPFSSCEGDNPEECTGYSVALCKRIAQRAVDEGFFCSVEYKKVSASERFSALHTGEIDMLCGASTLTLERMRVMDFSLFTFLSGISVMYDASLTSATEGNIKPVKIGVLENTTTQELLGEIWDKIKADLGVKKQAFTKTEFKDHFSGLAALATGKIRAYIADREILIALRDSLGRTDGNLKISRNYFSYEPYALGIALGDSELRFIANTVLSDLFTEDKKRKEMPIFDELRTYFPGSNFSKPMVDMYSRQRLQAGTPLVPPAQKPQCSKQ